MAPRARPYWAQPASRLGTHLKETNDVNVPFAADKTSGLQSISYHRLLEELNKSINQMMLEKRVRFVSRSMIVTAAFLHPNL